MEEKLCDHRLGKDMYETKSINPQKKKINNLNFIKMQTFLFNLSLRKWKKKGYRLGEWEKMFANYISDTGFIAQ